MQRHMRGRFLHLLLKSRVWRDLIPIHRSKIPCNFKARDIRALHRVGPFLLSALQLEIFITHGVLGSFPFCSLFAFPLPKCTNF